MWDNSEKKWRKTVKGYWKDIKRNHQYALITDEGVLYCTGESISDLVNKEENESFWGNLTIGKREGKPKSRMFIIKIEKILKEHDQARKWLKTKRDW